jgi:hypothetical protein
MRNNNRALMLGIAVLAGILTFGLGTASAFHAGGVAHCDGCHSMHNSPDNPVSGTPNTNLLIGTDPSSTCLNCHEGAGDPSSYHTKSLDATVWSPGGDFFWLTTSYTYNPGWGGPTNDQTSDPDNTGHNVIAVDFGLTQDGTNAVAPGGTYSSADLGCDSCHDPHGRIGGGTAGGSLPISVSGSYGDVPAAGTIAGNYRLLGDVGYNGLAAAPIAVIQSAGFPSLKYDESDTHHVAYGEGMSEWCASCHGDYINDNHKHPSGNGEHLNGQATTYNSYVATGDYTGIQATAFLALVPFERGETDTAALAAESVSTAGPDGTDNVMCLSCHRAHASAFNNATRWDMETEFISHSHPNAANLVDMGAVPDSPYYGRDMVADFGEYQRSLCNKCHVKD